MKRYLTILIGVGLAHFLATGLIEYLAQWPVVANFYLGVFGDSARIGSLFILILHPAFWAVRTFSPLSLTPLSPAAFLCLRLASSGLYGLLAVGIAAMPRFRRDGLLAG